MSQYYPPSGFFFRVNIDQCPSQTDASFQEVEGLSMEIETEPLQIGGQLDRNYIIPKGFKHSNLVLKRGIFAAKSDLATWALKTMQSGFREKITPRKILVKLLDPTNVDKMLALWVLFNAYPVKWNIAKFDSMKAEIVTETIELTYSHFQYKPLEKFP